MQLVPGPISKAERFPGQEGLAEQKAKQSLELMVRCSAVCDVEDEPAIRLNGSGSVGASFQGVARGVCDEARNVTASGCNTMLTQ